MDPSTPSSSRKRPRENETESQRLKREKAAERQRRKRERDRNNNNNAGMTIMAFSPTDQQLHQQHMQQQQLLQQQQLQQQQQQQHQQLQSLPQAHPGQSTPPDYSGQDLTPDEIARRDRVRAAARERQRKHRQLVKQRKMRELGLDMGNEIIPGMEEVHYRVGTDGQYQQLMSHEVLQQQQQQQQPPPMSGPHEPPFPQGQPLGGQTFASTLLLSFSCAPLLKQHLLRTLNMSNEELASLEPVLAEAWDRWDHGRRAHYAEHAIKAGLPPNMPGPPYPLVDLTVPHDQHPFAIPANGPGDATTNEFRARFHRSLVAPTPFRNFAAEGQAPAATPAPTSTSGSVPSPADTIDPHLATTATPAANGTSGTTTAAGSTAPSKNENRS